MSGLKSSNQFAVALAILLLPVLGYVGYWIFPTVSNQGYQPNQPIPFSHKLHAGDMKIDCLYCHSNADKSRHATVPALNVCMNCHRVVKTDSPLIQKITAAYNSGKPFEWVRIHELPDFAHFTHKRHVNAGVSCQTCHGPVETMEKVYQHAPLTMGWCMDCHRGATAPKNVLDHFYPEDQDNRGKPVAPTNCVTCHY
jgi:hypothetical protein